MTAGEKIARGLAGSVGRSVGDRMLLLLLLLLIHLLVPHLQLLRRGVPRVL